MNEPKAEESSMPFSALICDSYLPLDLIRSQQIIRIEILNVISLAKPQRPVSGRRGTLVFLSNDRYRSRREFLCDRKRAVRRAVIDDNNLGSRPGLGNRGGERFSDPGL